MVGHGAKVAALAVILSALMSVVARAQMDTAWVRRYSGAHNGTDSPVAVRLSGDSSIFVAGWSTGLYSGDDYLLLKYDTVGSLRWVRSYSGPVNGQDRIADIETGLYGSLYVTGWSYGGVGGRYDFATLKYGPGGELLWEARCSGCGVAYALVLDQSENVYVAGADGAYILAIKYNASGDTAWMRGQVFGSGNNDWPADIVTTADGSVYLLVTSWGTFTMYDLVLAKYDSVGNFLWAKRYDAGVTGEEIGKRLGVDSEGNILVLAYRSTPIYDFVLLKYNTDGTLLWERSFDGPLNGEDEPFDLIIDPFGRVAVAGKSCAPGGASCDFCVVRFSPDGDVEQEFYYDGPSGGSDLPEAFGIDAHGNLYLAGSTQVGDATLGSVTVALDSNGVLLWEEVLSDTARLGDLAKSLALDSDGNVYVAGVSVDSSSGADVVTIRYGPNCICPCFADPVCDAIPNVFDVIIVIEVAFRGGLAPEPPNSLCPWPSTDVNCSGATDVIDVVGMVGVVFRGADAGLAFCAPCSR